MTEEERIDQINIALEAIRSGWPFFMAALDERITHLTQSLIASNSEEIRGRIKALQELKELPESLISEREGLSAALADMAAAN